MPQYLGFYSTRRLTTAEATVIASSNVGLCGIMVNSTGTAVISLFHGVTGTSTNYIVGPIRTYTTVAAGTANTAVFIPIPARCSGGLTALLGASGDPDVTLFYAPEE